MSRREVSLSDLRRLHYGELSGPAQEHVRTAVDRDPQLAARLANLRQEEAAFRARTDVGAASAEILARLEAGERDVLGRAGRPRGRFWRPVFAALAPTALAVGAVLSLAPSSHEGVQTRTKGGGPSLEMYVKDAAGVHVGRDGVRLREGDRIQFKYHAFGKRHLMVVSVDGRGIVSPLYPDRPGPSIDVEPTGVHILKGSVILDDARGPEHIVALFSDAPLAYAEVKRAADDALARATDAVALPPLRLGRNDVREERVLIVKE